MAMRVPTICAVLIFLIPLYAQQVSNLRVLKTSYEETLDLMGTYVDALGVDCTFCHAPHSFASDDSPRKEPARRMILMTRELNAKLADDPTFQRLRQFGFLQKVPEGKAQITCYTCHRGEKTPKTEPPAAAPAKP